MSTTERAATNRENVGKIAAELELDADWFWKRYLEARNGATTPCEIPSDAIVKKDTPAAPQVKPFGLRVRGMHEKPHLARTVTAADPGEAFRQALATPCDDADPVIEWDDVERLACLDVDFHDFTEEYRPTQDALIEFMGHWQPAPAVAWLSHGRGIHGIFVAHGEWSAAELAATSALVVVTRFSGAKIEIKHETRHPKYPRLVKGVWQCCGEILEGIPIDADPTRALRRQLLQVDPSDSDGLAAEYRKRKGLDKPGRYTHDKCPFAPAHEAGKGKNPPVQVTETWVHCYYCQKQGRRCNATFRELALGLVPSPVGNAVDKWVHWGHAQHTVPQALGLEKPIAKRCYRSALKIAHGVGDSDPRLAAAMDPKNDLVRLDGYWGTSFGEALTKEIGPILATLPACQAEVPDAKSETGKSLRVIPATVARFSQPVDLADYGYSAVTPIFGVKVASHFNDVGDPRKPTAVFIPRSLRPYPETWPRHIPKDARNPVENAWKALEGPFPGICRPYVELLIAAKGFAEAQKEKPPALYVSGPSGAGKSAAVMVAAAICGDVCTDVVWHPQAERFRQGVMAAATQGSFCAINEAVKNGRAAGHAAVDVMDILLNFTEASVSHKLYVGAVAMGRLPVFIWTETDLPDDVKFDQQLARRLVWVELPTRVRWEEPLLNHGVDRPDRLRLAGPHYVDACNAILSDVIDRFFKDRVSFEHAAKELGFRPMEAASAQTVAGLLTEFHRAVSEAPVLPETHYGPGWRHIDIAGEGRLAKIWRELADVGGVSSRICRAQDWGKILGATTKYEERKDGRGVSVRFTPGGAGQLGPRPEADSPDRPGGAIDAGHPVRVEAVPGTPFDTFTLFGREAPDSVGNLDSAGSGEG